MSAEAPWLDDTPMSVPPAQQAERDDERTRILQAERVKAQQAVATAADPESRARAEGDVAALDRELAPPKTKFKRTKNSDAPWLNDTPVEQPKAAPTKGEPVHVDVGLNLDKKDDYPDETTRGVKPPPPPRTPLQAMGDVAGMAAGAAKKGFEWLDAKTRESNANVQSVVENPVQTAKDVGRNWKGAVVGMADPINTAGAYTVYPVMDKYKGVPQGTTHAEQVAEADRVFKEGTDQGPVAQNLREAGGFGATSLLTAGAGGAAAGPIRAAMGGGPVARAVAPVAADALAGGAYGAAEADLKGEDPTRAFATNALGAAGGSLFSRATGAGAKYISKPNSPEAERLLSRGFTLTPGQRSNNGILATMERDFHANPQTRARVTARQNETVNSVIDARIDNVTRNLGVTRNGTGKAAVRDMVEQVNSPQVYNRIVDDTFALPSTVRNAVNGARNRGVQLGPSRQREFNNLLDEIRDTASFGAQRPQPGTWYRYNGRAMADADVKLGEMIKNAGANTQEGKILRRLQDDLRGVTRGNTPEARQLLDQVRAARRELFGLEKGTKGKGVSGEKLDEGLRKNKQAGEPDVAAVEARTREGGPPVPEVGGGDITRLLQKAKGMAGHAMYSPQGIRAINAASRAAQGARGIYGGVPTYLRPGPYTTNAAREQGAPLIDEWYRQLNQQYE